MAVVRAGNWTPSLETSICCRCGPKKTNKTTTKKTHLGLKRGCETVEPALLALVHTPGTSPVPPGPEEAVRHLQGKSTVLPYLQDV